MKVRPLSIQSLYRAITSLPEIQAIWFHILVAKAHWCSLNHQVWAYCKKATTELTTFLSWLLDAAYTWWGHTGVLKYLWLTSHLATVVGFLMYVNVVPGGCHYEATLVACTITYLLVTYRSLRITYYNIRKSIERQSKSVDLINASASDFELSSVVLSENTQLVCVSVLLYLSPPNTLKLLSFHIYSVMNLLSYVLLEFCQSYTLSPGIEALNSVEFPLLMAANYSEIAVIFVYLRECFTTRNVSNFLLYLLLYVMKLMRSDVARLSLHSILIIAAKLLTTSPSSTIGPILLQILPVSPPANTPENNTDRSKLVRKKTRVASLIFDCFPVVNDIFEQNL